MLYFYNHILCDISLYKMAYVKETTTLYNTITSNFDTEIEKYQKVIVLKEDENYSLVQTEEDYMAYIDNNKIEMLPDTFVEVDISSQTMNYYENGVIVLTSPVVTGSNKHFTDLCYKKIYQKLRNTNLTGPTWNRFVKYWMAFNGGMGLHDASWKSEFGGDIYKENGSHGCVNLPENVAKELYNKVEIGTMVLVKR